MNGTCHLTFGLAASAACIINLNLIAEHIPNISCSAETGTLIALGGIIGSLLPDIDNPSSYVGKLCSPVSKMFGKIHKMQRKEEWQHRGIMHDMGVCLIGLALTYLYFPSLVGLFLGMFTHLFLDLFNPAGIPFLFGVKHLHLGKIKSSGKGATVFTGICTAAILAAGMGTYMYCS